MWSQIGSFLLHAVCSRPSSLLPSPSPSSGDVPGAGCRGPCLAALAPQPREPRRAGRGQACRVPSGQL